MLEPAFLFASSFPLLATVSSAAFDTQPYAVPRYPRNGRANVDGSRRAAAVRAAGE